jgi:hypothetical protein
MTTFSMQVDTALRQCEHGGGTVLCNDRKPYSVAIHRNPVTMPGEKWIQAEGESHDDAGRKVAFAFAQDLEDRSNELIRWAGRIRQALRQ